MWITIGVYLRRVSRYELLALKQYHTIRLFSFDDLHDLIAIEVGEQQTVPGAHTLRLGNGPDDFEGSAGFPPVPRAPGPHALLPHRRCPRIRHRLARP